MKYTRKWRQYVAHWSGNGFAKACKELTDDGWFVHTIVKMDRVGCDEGLNPEGIIIVAFKDEPDLSGGVPR